MKDQIFNKIHKLQVNKKRDLSRLTDKINEDYFNLPKGFLKIRLAWMLPVEAMALYQVN